jgi:AraC-like DNA-binding protein
MEYHNGRNLRLSAVKGNEKLNFNNIAYWTQNYIFIESRYKCPHPHKHFAKHIIISLEDEFISIIEGVHVSCKGIVIASEVKHTVVSTEPMLVFFVEEMTVPAKSLDKNYLKGNSHCCITNVIIEEIKNIWNYFKNKHERIDVNKILSQIENILQINTSEKLSVDRRVLAALEYIRNQEAIDEKIFYKAALFVNLSPSRLSHLFKNSVKISFKLYLTNLKFEKTVEYLLKGKNITNACMLAGFGSSSHFSSASQKILGLSMSYVLENIQFIKL